MNQSTDNSVLFRIFLQYTCCKNKYIKYSRYIGDITRKWQEEESVIYRLLYKLCSYICLYRRELWS
jgi:hypothetical protein